MEKKCFFNAEDGRRDKTDDEDEDICGAVPREEASVQDEIIIPTSRRMDDWFQMRMILRTEVKCNLIDEISFRSVPFRSVSFRFV